MCEQGYTGQGNLPDILGGEVTIGLGRWLPIGGGGGVALRQAPMCTARGAGSNGGGISPLASVRRGRLRERDGGGSCASLCPAGTMGSGRERLIPFASDVGARWAQG